MTRGGGGTGTDRLDVRSADGTKIAVWVHGQGPALVLVHGSIQDHSGSAELVRELSSHLTTFALDRRGFGASGDAARYAIARKFEDVGAVVDAVADRVGGPVALWGHSYGAGLALGGAALTPNVNHLVLYEPGLGLSYPARWVERVEEAVAKGDHEGAVLLVLRDLLVLTDEQVDAVRSRPDWAARVATAPTIAREARAEQAWEYRAGQLEGIVAPVLLLSGSESPAPVKQATEAAAAALPGARVHVLQGHAHVAHRAAPAMVAAVVRGFLGC